MKTIHTMICKLLVLATLFAGNAAQADDAVADENSRIETSVESTIQQDTAYLTIIRRQLTEDMQQQLTVSIRTQVQFALTELAAAVKQVVSN